MKLALVDVQKRYGDYLGKKICFLKESGYICRK